MRKRRAIRATRKFVKKLDMMLGTDRWLDRERRKYKRDKEER